MSIPVCLKLSKLFSCLCRKKIFHFVLCIFSLPTYTALVSLATRRFLCRIKLEIFSLFTSVTSSRSWKPTEVTFQLSTEPNGIKILRQIALKLMENCKMLKLRIRSDPTLPSCCFGFRVATARLSRQNIDVRRRTNVSMLRIDVGGGEKMREDICWINVMRTHWIVRGDLR